MNRTDKHGTPEFTLNLHDLRDTGLLWKINHDVLHPLGLALAVATADVIPDDVDALSVSLMVARDGVWTFPAEMDAGGRAAFAGWYRGTAFPLMTERSTEPCAEESYYRCPICGTCRPDAAVACLVCP